jgi:hypothetical protein
MINSVIKQLIARKIKIINEDLDSLYPLESEIQTAFDSEQFDHLKDSFSVVAIENIIASIQFKKCVTRIISPSDDCCVFLHGSTGHGAGRIAPNIDFHIKNNNDRVQMETAVLLDCRDDIDLVMIVNNPTCLSDKINQVIHEISDNKISITVNLLSWENAFRDLRNNDSPAIRRILLFSNPKILIGKNKFIDLKNEAFANQTVLDVPHEVDFRLLMQLSEILTNEGLMKMTFLTDDLLLAFPTLFLAGSTGLHIGFPQKREKIAIQY